MRYKRWIYFLVTFVVIGVGLASRKYDDILPGFIARYAGDTLWAVMVYLGVRFLFFPISIQRAVVGSLLFSYCIEISQLYQADWINDVRSTTFGALIFGHGFLWLDMACYSVGIFFSAIVDYCFCRHKIRRIIALLKERH